MSCLAAAETVIEALICTFICFDQEARHERESPQIEVTLGLLQTDEGLAIGVVNQSQYRAGLVCGCACRPGNGELMIKSVFEVYNDLLILCE